MKDRLSRLILAFSILSAFFIIAPAFLSSQFTLYPLMKNGDVLDLFTPLVLIPLYWLLFQISPQRPPNQKEIIIFIVLVVMWVQGQGMHLVGNSIGHLTQDPATDNKISTLTYFYDETLSHYWWHIGLIGLSALLIYRQWQNPISDRSSGLQWETTAGVIYGINYFIDVVESATTIIGVPFAAAIAVWIIVRRTRHLRRQPILAFFFVAYFVASLLFFGWGLYWGGFPEFSEVGII